MHPFETPYDPVQDDVTRLQNALRGLFTVNRVQPQQDGVVFFGRLAYDPEFSYDQVEQRFGLLGYTPLFSRRNSEDVITALDGTFAPAKPGRPWLNLLLFVVTVLTTLAAGGMMVGQNLWGALFAGDATAVVSALRAGIPFSLSLLSILAVHEFGHYFAARWHKVKVSLPYFIPLPGLGLGTLGAFISLKSPMKNRKVLFDIGVSGPLAGFAIALPLFIFGLFLSSEVSAQLAPNIPELGRSPLVYFLQLVIGRPADGQVLIPHPVYYAAWIGLLITALNLLPAGQLDGGHIAYALFGRYADRIAFFTVGALLLAGIFFSTTWLFWAFFIFMTGMRHPPPLNDIIELDPMRRSIGIFAILLFTLLFVTSPFG
ncbi:MAG: site-2 protease family protein [Anaerolineales bacterium]|nr:site-2 protease family protein [Anaerolineales bacterium]